MDRRRPVRLAAPTRSLSWRQRGSLGTGLLPYVTWLPLFLFTVLFALSMDYHVFIVSRIKELVDGGWRPARRSPGESAAPRRR
jgi:hypothetical protein